MKQILCLSAEPYSADGSRTQQLLAAFPEAEVLFFQPETTALPVRGKRVAPNIWVYTLPTTVATREEAPFIPVSDRKRLVQLIGKAMQRHGFDQPLFWVGTPLYDELLEELPRSGLIYDCAHDWSALPIRLESRLCCRADIVFAASEGVREHLSPCNENIILIPAGIDFHSFDAVKTNDFLCPGDLVRLPRPVFGYVGTIWSNLNLAPVKAAATAHPEWSFVFIGRVGRKNPYLNALRRCPNVHFLGRRYPEELPAYLRHLTAGISLLRDGEEDIDILSPRIFEYFAQGLPVVAMYHHLQREVYPTLIDSAYSAERFVDMCEKVLRDDPTEKKVARYHIAREADWSFRRQQVRQALDASRLLEELDLRKAPVRAVSIEQSFHF